jgi:hypothetical protein
MNKRTKNESIQINLNNYIIFNAYKLY